MKLLLILCSLLVSCCCIAQRLTYPEVISFINKPHSQIVETLMSKGYEQQKSADWEELFEVNKGKESMSVRFSDYSSGNKEILIQFSQAYDKDYLSIMAQIKAKYKKLRFFFHSGLGFYTPEYYINGAYIYFVRGLSGSIYSDFKYGGIVICSKKGE